MISKIRLPWFRVHIILLNDPGRLISAHIMHSGLAAGWAGVMVFYELIILDPTDPYIIQFGDKVVIQYLLFQDWVLHHLFIVGH